MGVTIETISRWEHGSSGMRVSAERLLRVIAAMDLGISPSPMDQMGMAPREEIAIRLAWEEEHWVIVMGRPRARQSGASDATGSVAPTLQCQAALLTDGCLLIPLRA
jgi:transcriptional regulator with XRE-family HTH domain